MPAIFFDKWLMCMTINLKRRVLFRNVKISDHSSMEIMTINYIDLSFSPNIRFYRVITKPILGEFALAMGQHEFII